MLEYAAMRKHDDFFVSIQIPVFINIIEDTTLIFQYLSSSIKYSVLNNVQNMFRFVNIDRNFNFLCWQ